MDKFLKDNGFVATSTCNCGGRWQANYVNSTYPEYKVKYFKGTDTFCLLRNNLRVTRNDEKAGYAEQILKEYGLTKI